MKRCSASLSIRGMQIKNAVRYHLAPVRMVIIKKTRNSKCWWGCGEKGSLMHCWWECKLVQPLWRTAWRFLKNLKIELPYAPAIPLLDIYTKEMKSVSWRAICSPMCTAVLFTIGKIRKQLECPLMDEWIKKMWYIHEMEYFPVVKRRKSCYLQQHGLIIRALC